MPKLLLIDGNAILHRAFHAYPPSFSDAAGNPTNAIYGFYAMLLKVMEETKPDLVTICFDRGEPTFRMNLYVGYHANRPKMADTLAPQVPRLQESLKKIGFPIEAVEGYEADDLLGTLAKQAGEDRHSGKRSASRIKEGSWTSQDNSLETVILTGDRDLLQLVNKHTKILMPITGITKSVLMGEKEVEEKYGVKSNQFIDYKAIVGDQSDGYPGVSGIGPKGAASLLQAYGTLENIYAHLQDIKPEIAQKLATDAEQCMLAKKLATIHVDAPVHLDTKKADVENFTPDKFLEVFEEFNIHSLARRLLDGKVSNPSTSLRVKESNASKVSKGKDSDKNEMTKKARNDKKSNDQLELL